MRYSKKHNRHQYWPKSRTMVVSISEYIAKTTKKSQFPQLTFLFIRYIEYKKLENKKLFSKPALETIKYVRYYNYKRARSKLFP